MTHLQNLGEMRANFSVLNRGVLKTLTFAKRGVLKRGVLKHVFSGGGSLLDPKRLRFRDLRGKTLAFKKKHCDYFLPFRGFPQGQGWRSGPLRSNNAAFCVCVVKPSEELTLSTTDRDALRSIAVKASHVMPFCWLEVVYTSPIRMTYTSHLYHSAFAQTLPAQGHSKSLEEMPGNQE